MRTARKSPTSPQTNRVDSATLAAKIKSSGGKSKPRKQSDPQLTIGNAAAQSFEALKIDLNQLRPKFERMWPGIAVASAILTKSPDECVAMVRKAEEDHCVGSLMDRLQGDEWFVQTAEVIKSAKARLICACARLALEEGANPDDPL